SRALRTRLGVVQVKQAEVPGGPHRYKAEHDDLAALARRHGLSLDQVRQVVDEAAAGDNAWVQPPTS
ncbi:MAG: nickel insertion protein, partial [Prochlorococcaceae cyanobacterium]